MGISGLGAWFDSGYMVYVSSWVLLNRLPCSPCTWKLDAPLRAPCIWHFQFAVWCWRNAWFDCFLQGGLWKNLYVFLHEGVELWILRLILVLLFSPCSHADDEVAGSSSTKAVACVFCWVFLVLTHLALCSRRCRYDGMHTVRSVHSRCFSLFFLRALCIFSISLQSHFCASGFFGALELSQV